MIRKFVLLFFLTVALFTMSLTISYYGFQVSPDFLQTSFSEDPNIVCTKMNAVLQLHNMSYTQIARSISSDTLDSLDLNNNEMKIIEQCMQNDLPTLGSYILSEKLGYLDGINNHDAKGKAVVVSIENKNYLRLENFEISYDSKLATNFQNPELHVYLGKGNTDAPEIHLSKLKTKLGSKNYLLPDVDLNLYNTVVIYDVIHKDPYAKVILENPFFIRDVIKDLSSKTHSIPNPKFESRIIYERHGFFESVNNYDAKGLVTLDYSEDEGLLHIENFEISKGHDLRLYITKDGTVAKSGFWTFGSDGNFYVSSGTTNQILRYSPDGKFLDVFVTANSGGLDGPNGLIFGPDNNLYVSSGTTNQILRYSPDGKFLDVFVTANSGGLDGPKDLIFDPDGKYLFVASFLTNEVFRYDANNGAFIDAIISSHDGGISNPTYAAFGPDNNLYVSSGTTNQILRYSPDGKFLDVFVDSEFIKMPQGLIFGPDGNLFVSNNELDSISSFDGYTGSFIDIFASGGGLDGPNGLIFGPDNNLYVSSGTTNQILRYSPDGKFLDVFVDSEFIKMPQGLIFGPDGNHLYVVSSTNEIIRKNILSENSKIENLIRDRSVDLLQPKKIGFDNNRICVSNYFTNDIHCYDNKTGNPYGIVVKSFDRGLSAKENSVLSPGGNLYASNSLSGEIIRYDANHGIFSNVAIATESDKLSGPTDLTFGPDNNLYVSSSDKIFRFNGVTGDFLDIFITHNKGKGLDNPRGISFSTDSLFVSSHDNNRVLRYNITTGNFLSDFVETRKHGLFGPIGNVVDDQGNFYVTNTLDNSILQYSIENNQFLKSIDLEFEPHSLAFGNGMLFVSFYSSNNIGAYDLNDGTMKFILSDEDGLSGPTGLAYDPDSHILYISSSKNNRIYAYLLEDNTYSLISILLGNGILQYPQGLSFHDGSLYVANSNNNEILKYDPITKTLNEFIYDFSDSIKPGGMAFESESILYTINEIDNKIYYYDIDSKTLLGVFNIFDSLIPSVQNDTLNNIAFSKDGKYLFASTPRVNQLLAFDTTTGYIVDDFFEETIFLKHPTKLLLSPDGNYVLVLNYEDNKILRFTSSGNFDSVFITPDNNKLYPIKNFVFGQDLNLYVLGGNDNAWKTYDGTSGKFLGDYIPASKYLGILEENLLNTKYLLNEIDTHYYDVIVVYDEFLETSYAVIPLHDTVDIFTPLSIASNSVLSIFDTVSEPKLHSKHFTEKTGFFMGMNDINAYGQVKSKSIDHTSIIILENFFLNYNKNDYVSTALNPVITNGPNVVACLVTSLQECKNPNSVELGGFKINAGDNNFLVRDIDLNKYDEIVIFDKNLEKTFAHIPLRDYGVLRVSGDSFLDWIQFYLPVFPVISIIIMIFPMTFDYMRTGFKIIFFAFHIVFQKHKRSRFSFQHNPKITILIPAHNEEYGIKKSIETALATDYSNKEVIVIDDGSKDNTFLIANNFAEKGLIKLVHRETASGSKATALNYGMNYATGDLVLCMDGDTLLDKNALKNAVEHFVDTDVVAVSGNVRILSGDDGINNTLTKLQTYEYMIAIELGRRFTSFFQILLVISGAFGIFKRNIIGNVHTFDKDTLTEDFDLTLKLRKTKGKIRFVGNSIAYTYCPNSWPIWVKQRNRWAFGQFQTLSKNRNILTSKFPLKDKVSFFDMFVLDVILSMLFPIGLAVLATISVILLIADNLHILVYSMTFVMVLFMISELVIFIFATIYSGKLSYLKLIYLVPVMTFFYRPYLKMVNLRAYFRAYFGKKSTW